MNRRLLIVDDSPVMRSFIRRTLALSGLTNVDYHEAGDGSEALAWLETGSPDLILTDINMPVMDGEELLQALKGQPRTSGIPVVVVSTDSTQARVGRLMSLGACGYVRKPFTPEQLAAALGTLVPGLYEA